MTVEQELRVMHACETGAVGVYRGHKCVARYFFRANLTELDGMRFHEQDHAATFKRLLQQRDARLCFGYQVFFFGGLLYGATIGLLGIKAIGTSTHTIENIVNDEFDIALQKLKDHSGICLTVQEIQREEQQHKDAGMALVGDNYLLQSTVALIAKSAAYAAKNLASAL